MSCKQTLYKLTDRNHRTHGGTLWGRGVTHEATGSGGLCTGGVIHAYEGDPRVALLMNRIQADIKRPVVWLAEGVVTHRDGPLKCGCKSLTTIRVIPTPLMTTEQTVEIAIRCAITHCNLPSWNEWAGKWLSGEDRTPDAAEVATGKALEVNATPAVRAARAASVFNAAPWVSGAVVTAARPNLDLPAIIRKVCGPLDKHAEEAKR